MPNRNDTPFKFQMKYFLCKPEIRMIHNKPKLKHHANSKEPMSYPATQKRRVKFFSLQNRRGSFPAS